MQITQISVRINGVAPMIQHNIQLLDPTNKYTLAMKDITSKGKKKTDADLAELKRLEFAGGLYIDDSGPYIPSEWIESTIRDGAKKNRRGPAAKAGVFCPDDRYHLAFAGPKTIDALFADEVFVDVRGVVVGGKSRVMRTRPRFPKWSLSFQVAINDEVVSVKDLRMMLDQAGMLVGMGDYRPKYGRFLVEAFEVMS